MILSNCNCGKKVECGCYFSFDSWDNNLISILSVGNLLGGECILDEYVIDWYRDGEHAMVSGKGNDPDIETFHPFVGSEAVPVPPGEWTPVIRYVVIGGQQIYMKGKKCKSFCEYQGELPNIIVVNKLNCGLIGEGENNAEMYYDFRLKYSTSQDFSLASRTIRFYLDQDTRYVALQFNGFQVADLIEVFYKEESAQLLAYVIGTNLPRTDATVFPEEIDWNRVKMVINLEDRTFQEGDYLTIKINPSVKEPGNYNTNWTLDMKCLPANSFRCDWFSKELRKIDLSTVDCSFDSTNCRYVFTWYYQNVMPSSFSSSNTFKYFYPGHLQTVNTRVLFYNPLQQVYIDSKIAASSTTILSITQNTNSAGRINYTKTGDELFFEFTHQDDYNAYKNSLNRLESDSRWNSYTEDPADENHYKFYLMLWREADTCGDTYVSRDFYFHYSSDVVFDDAAMTIFVKMKNVANGLTQADECNELYDLVDSYILYTQNDIDSADFSGETGCMNVNPISGRYIYTYVDASNVGTFYRQYYFLTESLDSVCGLGDLFTTDSGYYHRYIFTYMYTRVWITNMDDPTNNFRIESAYDNETGENVGWNSIYEKANGIQITP